MSTNHMEPCSTYEQAGLYGDNGYNAARGGSRAANDTCAMYVAKLIERYKDRGISAKIRQDVAEQERAEALNRAKTPGSYVDAESASGGNADKYRSGDEDGMQYMTAGDFVNYFHDQRRYKTPVAESEPNVEKAVAYRASEGTAPKKAAWLTVSDKWPAFLRRALEHPFVEKLGNLASEWVPAEACENTGKGERRRLPVSAVASVAMLAILSMLVVGGSVMVSLETGNVSRAKNDLAVMEATRDKLESELEMKNNMLEFEKIASNDINMVKSDYISSDSVKLAGENKIEIVK